MNQKGQGLLEALIATTIIVVGLSGIIGLAGNNLVASNISTGELLAVNLAREAVEVVTNLRDSNYLDNEIEWNDGLDTGTNDREGIIKYDDINHTWSVDFLGLNTDFTDSATIVYLDSTTGLYRQNNLEVSGWEATPYRRLVYLYRICGTDIDTFLENGQCPGGAVGYRILAKVQWDDHGNTRELSLEKRIFNWR